MNFRLIPIILVCFILVATACIHKDTPGRGVDPSSQVTGISGVLEEGAGRQVILEEMAAREYIPVDTVTCDQDASFLISFNPERTAFYVLRIGPPGYVTLLIEPGETIRFEGRYGQPSHYTVKGSAGSGLLMELGREHKRILDTLARITRKNMELRSSPRYADLKGQLDLEFDSVTSGFHDYSLDFIHRNRGSLATLVALYNLYGEGLPVFHPGQDLEVYRYVDSVLTPEYGDFEIVELLHAQIVEAEASMESNQQFQGPGIGEIAPDFVSSRPGGEQLALKDLEGNYILLSFWAAWSKTSREENRYLTRAWDKYSASPFRILQVSFDSDRTIWTRAIEADRLTWDHVSDLRRWESAIADLYQVEKIPSNYLIDPEGRIIGMDLFGDALIEKLELLFRKN